MTPARSVPIGRLQVSLARSVPIGRQQVSLARSAPVGRLAFSATSASHPHLFPITPFFLILTYNFKLKKFIIDLLDVHPIKFVQAILSSFLYEKG